MRSNMNLLLILIKVYNKFQVKFQTECYRLFKGLPICVLFLWLCSMCILTEYMEREQFKSRFFPRWTFYERQFWIDFFWFVCVCVCVKQTNFFLYFYSIFFSFVPFWLEFFDFNLPYNFLLISCTFCVEFRI